MLARRVAGWCRARVRAAADSRGPSAVGDAIDHHRAELPVAGGIAVVHTPGHTPGHCSFLHPSSGVLITGDAIFNVRGLRWSFASACTDVTLSRTSAARLGELDFSVAGFTHGPHVSTGAQAAVRAFLAGRPS